MFSLTVRVQRMSDIVVENANPLFERGSTTTYTSFKNKYHVKAGLSEVRILNVTAVGFELCRNMRFDACVLVEH